MKRNNYNFTFFLNEFDASTSTVMEPSYAGVIVSLHKNKSIKKCGLIQVSQPAFTCTKLVIEILEQGTKYIQS